MKNKMKIAIASSNGIYVNLHFSKAGRFMIYEIKKGIPKLLEIRENKITGNHDGCGPEIKSLLDKVAELVEDCNIIVCYKIGGCGRDQFARKNIKVIESQELISDVLSKIANVGANKDKEFKDLNPDLNLLKMA
jgi:predicted Fe-Mo cluster-binding NifX family protein